MVAVHLADEAVDVDDETLRARAGACLPGPGEGLSRTLSNWRTWPKVKERRKVPRVEGAATRWGRTADVWPERSTSQSSMQSASSAIAQSIVATLAPGLAAPGRSPRSTHSSTNCSIPNRPSSAAGTITPALATARSSSKTTAAESFTIRVTS